MWALPRCATTLLCLAFSIARAQSDSIFEPSPSLETPTYVSEGEPGPTLHCSIKEPYRDDDVYDLFWMAYTDTGIRHVSKNDILLKKDALELKSDRKNGVYDLKIKKIIRGQTDGEYQCLATNQETLEQFHNALVKIVVLVPPGDPKITQQPSTPVRQNELMFFKCRSEGGSPPPEIEWRFGKDSDSVPVDSRLYSREIEADAVVSSLQLSARPEANGAFVTCIVKSKANEKDPKKVHSSRLNVLFPPQIDVGPSHDYAVEEGQRIELNCTGTGNPDPTGFEWKHLATGERFMEAHWPFTVERKNAGEFECKARNTVGESKAPLRLDVQYGPKVSTEELITPSEGDHVTVECTVDANPKEEEVSWEGPHGFTARGNTLSLPEISSDQSGNYTCKAMNYLRLYGQVGTQQRMGYGTVKIDVRRRPGRALISPSRLSVPIGGTIALSCQASDPGSPVAEYKWASPSSGMQFGSSDHAGDTLRIRNAQLSDNGMYTCLPYNSIGEGEPSKVLVTVVEPASISKVLTIERVFNAGESSTGLECEAQGYPAPSISWLRDGRAIDTDRLSVHSQAGRTGCQADEACTQTVTSTLSFKEPIEWFDKGNYSCEAQNGGFKPASSWSMVHVVHAPQILNDVYKSESLSAANPGEPARIACRVSARPSPNFSWLRDSTEIEAAGRYSTVIRPLNDLPDEYESILTVHNASEADFGQYLCRASNGKGDKAEVIIRLQRKSKPDPPQNLRVISTSPTSVFIAWKRGFDGGYPQTYVLEYKKMDPFSETFKEEYTTVEMQTLQRIDIKNGDQNRAKRSISVTSLAGFNVTNLQPKSMYTMRLRAKNNKGMSEMSEDLQLSTDDVYEDATFEAPNDVVFNQRTQGLSLQPSPSPELCVQLYVSFGNGFRGVGCYTSDIADLPGGGSFRIRFCERAQPLHCSILSREVLTPAPFSAKWRFVIPLFVGFIVIILVLILASLCCRRSSPKERKPKRIEIRPEVSGPLPSLDAKNTVTHGSATDSGVFTLENGQKGHTDYTNQNYSGNETVPERDSWPPNTAGHANFDPFHNDPYLSEYDGGAWRTSVHDSNGSSGQENQTATTHSEGGDSDSDAYSSGRVIREIIV